MAGPFENILTAWDAFLVMALSNKEDIKTELEHAMMLPDRQKNAVRSVMGAADEAEEEDLEEVQRLLKMIVDAEYEEPDLL